jgi:hypothetical protein
MFRAKKLKIYPYAGLGSPVHGRGYMFAKMAIETFNDTFEVYGIGEPKDELEVGAFYDENDRDIHINSSDVEKVKTEITRIKEIKHQADEISIDYDGLEKTCEIIIKTKRCPFNSWEIEYVINNVNQKLRIS